MDNKHDVYKSEQLTSYPRFIRVALFESPQSAAYWKGNAALIAGNSMYGKIVLLESVPYYSKNIKDSEMAMPFTVSEWEWDGGKPLEGNELRKTIELYEKYTVKQN